MFRFVYICVIDIEAIIMKIMKNTILAIAFTAVLILSTGIFKAQISRTVEITESYTGINLAGNQILHFEIGPAAPVTVIGKTVDLDNLQVSVKNGTLVIKYPNRYRASGRVEIYVKNPTLSNISVAGAASFKVTGGLDNGNKDIKLAGSGNIDIHGLEALTLNMAVAGSGSIKITDILAGPVESKISGSGKITLAGIASDLTAKIAGSGRIKAEELQVMDCTVKIAGSGSVDTFCTETLNPSVNGSGTVNYYGDPKTVNALTRTKSKSLKKKK